MTEISYKYDEGMARLLQYEINCHEMGLEYDPTELAELKRIRKEMNKHMKSPPVLTEKQVQEAHALLAEHSRYRGLINLRDSPPVSMKSAVCGFPPDRLEFYDVKVDQLSISFDEKSEFVKTLRHLIKNEVYNRLQAVEHKLQLLGVEVPDREPEAISSPAYTYGTSSAYPPRPNWLKE
jgi:hypothetical protein